jgi:hypothetical protein
MLYKCCGIMLVLEGFCVFNTLGLALPAQNNNYGAVQQRRVKS